MLTVIIQWPADYWFSNDSSSAAKASLITDEDELCLLLCRVTTMILYCHAVCTTAKTKHGILCPNLQVSVWMVTMSFAH